MVGRGASTGAAIVPVLVCVLALAASAAGKPHGFTAGGPVPAVDIQLVSPTPSYPGQIVTFQVEGTAGFNDTLPDVWLCVNPQDALELESSVPADNVTTLNGACVDAGELANGQSASASFSYVVADTVDYESVAIFSSMFWAEGDGSVADQLQMQVTPFSLSPSAKQDHFVFGSEQGYLEIEIENESSAPVSLTTPFKVCSTGLPTSVFPATSQCNDAGAVPKTAAAGSKLRGIYDVIPPSGTVNTSNPSYFALSLSATSGGIQTAPSTTPIKVVDEDLYLNPPPAQLSFADAGPIFVQGQTVTVELEVQNPYLYGSLTDLEACVTFPDSTFELSGGSPTPVSVAAGRACATLSDPVQPGDSGTVQFELTARADAPYGNFVISGEAEPAQTAEVRPANLSGQIAAGDEQLSTLLFLTSTSPGNKGYGQGDTLSFKLQALNTGGGTLTGVELCHALPQDANFTNASATPSSVHGSDVCFDVGSLAPGATESIDLNATIGSIGAGAPLTSDLTATSDETNSATDQLGLIYGTDLGSKNQVAYNVTQVSSGPLKPGDKMLVHMNAVGEQWDWPAFDFSPCILYTGAVAPLSESDPDAAPGTIPGKWCGEDNPLTIHSGAQSNAVLEFEVPANAGPGVFLTDGLGFGPPVIGFNSAWLDYTPITVEDPSLTVQPAIADLPPGPYEQGDVMGQQLIVANTGNETLTNVEVCDAYSDDLDLLSAGGASPACYQVGEIGVNGFEIIEQEFEVTSVTDPGVQQANAITATSDQTPNFVGAQPFVLGEGDFTMSAEVVDDDLNLVSGALTPTETYATQVAVANPSGADVTGIEICAENMDNLVAQPYGSVPVETAAYNDSTTTSTGTARCFTVNDLHAGQTLIYEFPFQGEYPSTPGTFSQQVTASASNGQNLSDSVSYEIEPVPNLESTVVLDYPDENQNYAGSDVRFDITVENTSNATAAAQDAAACLDLTNTLIVYAESSSGMPGSYVNGQGQPCVGAGTLAPGQQASGWVEYAIPYYATGHGFEGANGGTATLCATAQNGVPEAGDVECASATYVFNVRANPAYRSTNANNVVTLKPNTKRTRSGKKVRYALRLRNTYTAGDRPLQLPLFDLKACHKVPKGMTLIGANRKRKNLAISGRRVCARAAEIPEGAQRQIKLVYRVTHRAPKRIRSKATLAAAGVAGSAANKPLLSDKAKLRRTDLHRSGGSRR